MTGTIAGMAELYARNGYEVLPLIGKVPAVAKRYGGHGVLDASSDLEQVRWWWSDAGRAVGAGPTCNIGCRVPAGLLVIDIDPRSGGADTVACWENHYGPLPVTRMSWSGRGDGGRHLWFRRPSYEPTAKALAGTGVDLKTHSGYVVLPPSLHPDTGQPYRWEDLSVPAAELPLWLAQLLRPAPVELKPQRRPTVVDDGGSVIDWFNASTAWPELLRRWQWRPCNEAGTVWAHPTATNPTSATIRGDRLYIYSSSTAFDMTTAGDPHGYSRFDAWSTHEHHGDYKAAATAAAAMRRDHGRVIL